MPKIKSLFTCRKAFINASSTRAPLQKSQTISTILQHEFFLEVEFLFRNRLDYSLKDKHTL